MNIFNGKLRVDAVVPGDLDEVYAVLREPAFIERSTPFIRRVVDLGEDRWLWEVAGINYPGGRFAAAFIERMHFQPPRLVTFEHEPRGRELAGADGAFRLGEGISSAGGMDRGAVTGGSGGLVALDLEVHVHATIPAPRAAAPVVEKAMTAVLAVMRDRFVRTLQATLGDDLGDRDGRSTS